MDLQLSNPTIHWLAVGRRLLLSAGLCLTAWAAPAQAVGPAGAANVAAKTLISNKIQFHGQVPDNQTNYRPNPLDLCPNVVDPNNYGIQSQPY